MPCIGHSPRAPSRRRTGHFVRGPTVTGFFLIPAFGVLWGALFLGETVTGPTQATRDAKLR